MSIKTFIAESIKDSPVVGVGGAAIMGVQLDTWVLILAIIYGVGRIAWLVIEAYWKWEDRRNGKVN